LFLFRARESIRAPFSRSLHRFRKRVRASIHVSLRRRDAGVAGEHLQFVNRHAIVSQPASRAALFHDRGTARRQRVGAVHMRFSREAAIVTLQRR
jgi:hypothetical protein